jgi:hypothetical protein
MTLQHELRLCGACIPEAHPTILRARHDPVPIVRRRHRQHEVLMGDEVHRRLDRPLIVVLPSSTGHRTDVPVFERLVERGADEALAVDRKRDRVHAIPVPAELLKQLAGVSIPDADDGVQRAGGDEAVVRGDGHGCDAGIDLGFVDREDALDGAGRIWLARHVPDPSGTVARARDNEATVLGELEGVDVLRVAVKHLGNTLLFDVPNLPKMFSHRHISLAQFRTLTRIRVSSAPVAKNLPSGLKQTVRMYRSPSLLVFSSTSMLYCHQMLYLSGFQKKAYHVFAPVFTSKI